MSHIKLVKNDNRPVITVTVTDDSTGQAIDVSTATVRLKFRQQGTTTLLSTITCTKPTGGVDGVVQFQFSGTVLNVSAGMYEGEIEITFLNGDVQTVYDTLKFKVRDEF